MSCGREEHHPSHLYHVKIHWRKSDGACKEYQNIIDFLPRVGAEGLLDQKTAKGLVAGRMQMGPDFQNIV